MLVVNLSGANLMEADLRGVKQLTCEELKWAEKWEHTYRDETLACGAFIPEPPKQEDGESDSDV